MTETLLKPVKHTVVWRGRRRSGNQDASRRRRAFRKNSTGRRASSRTDPGQPLTGLKLPSSSTGSLSSAANNVLVARQNPGEQRELNGLYKLTTSKDKTPVVPSNGSEAMNQDDQLWEGLTVLVKSGSDGLKNSYWELRTGTPTLETSWSSRNSIRSTPASRHGPFIVDRLGVPGQLESQLINGADDKKRAATLARIYAFSYEGTYYELPAPVVFLVHGTGKDASEAQLGRRGRALPARAPGDPSLTGLSAARLPVHRQPQGLVLRQGRLHLRMEVQTGMFEQMLLDMFSAATAAASAARASPAPGSAAPGFRCARLRCEGLGGTPVGRTRRRTE